MKLLIVELSIFALLCLALGACSEKNSGESNGAGNDGVDSADTSNNGGGSEIDSSLDTNNIDENDDSENDDSENDPVGGDTSGVEVDSGTPEVCDKIDNDNNGIIDDVDVGGDGICDCLNIGTIGSIGPWSSGGDIFKTWLDTRSPLPATALADQVITPELLAGLDIIVVLRADTQPLAEDDSPAHHLFSEEEVLALEAWVRDGGGLMTTIGYQGDEAAEVQNVNQLLAPFGLRYHDEQEFLNLHGLVDTWADHPVAVGVESVITENGTEPDPEGGTAIAWSASQQVAMVVGTPDTGHVIVFGDEWITYDSEWEDIEEQQVELLWVNMLKWLSPEEECQVPIPAVLVE